MGQCLACNSKTATEEKEGLTVPPRRPTRKPSDDGDDEDDDGDAAAADSPRRRKSGVESAPDSGHSSGDDASCGGGVGVGPAGAVEGRGRNSHSSESSGKYSMRGEERTDEFSVDMPVFCEEKSVREEEEEDDDGGVFTHDAAAGQDSLHPLQGAFVTRPRNYSRGSSSRGSRGSLGSERGSFSSVTSAAALKARLLGRSSSLTATPEADVLSTSSMPQRTVSLRLPRSQQHDSDTNLPTIYVDDSPQQQQAPRRRSSLRRALSLLSLNALLRNDAVSSLSSSKKSNKPVKRILRQPRRRHNTVRGLSGLAIERSNQGVSYSGLQRSHTLYYPTATSLRYASTARRTKSTNT